MLDDIRDDSGVVRRLGYVRPDESKKMMRAARTNIQTIRSNANLKPLIQPGDPEWREIDLTVGHPDELWEDQEQEGACTCAAATGSSSRQRYVRTGKVIKLSWRWLYDQINGGRDAGSNIIDSMEVLESKGAPPAESYTKSLFRANQNPPGVTWYQEDVAITGSSSIEFATMILMGGYAEGPILVNSNFEKWTGDGVAFGGGAPNSSNSNHAIYLAGIKFLQGDPKNWVFKLINSWGLKWGPFKKGFCYLNPKAIDNAADADDGYGHMSSPSSSPQAPTATA